MKINPLNDKIASAASNSFVIKKLSDKNMSTISYYSRIKNKQDISSLNGQGKFPFMDSVQIFDSQYQGDIINLNDIYGNRDPNIDNNNK